MIWTPPLALNQATAELPVLVERIASAQIVMAVGTSILVLAVLAAMVGAFMLFRSVRRLTDALEREAQRLGPHAVPLLEHASRVGEDARAVSHAFRADAENLHETVGELNRRLRATLDDADERVHQFGGVLRVIQDEIETLLLDAAATARGLHAAAEGLQNAVEGRPPDRPTLDG